MSCSKIQAHGLNFPRCIFIECTHETQLDPSTCTDHTVGAQPLTVGHLKDKLPNC
jgi:hypothetical protein